MEHKDKIIRDYFAQLPEQRVGDDMMARLVELGQRTLAEHEAVRADRGGIWIAIAATVVLVGILVGIFSYFGVDFGAMWGSVRVERTPISDEALSAFVPWAILGTLALTMLVTYSLLMRRHTFQRENYGK